MRWLLATLPTMMLITPALALAEIPGTAEQVPVTWQYTLNKPTSDSWIQPTFDDSSWIKGTAGFGLSMTPGTVVRTEWKTPDIWMRREFELTAEDVKAIRALRLHHDEDVRIYLNGKLAMAAYGYQTGYEDRSAEEDALETLKPSRNVLAVYCHQTVGGQYIDVGLSANAPKAMTWLTDLQTARSKCARESRNLLILYVSNESTRGSEVEKSALSGSLVRRVIDERFVPLKLNMSGSPADATALGVFRAGTIDLFDSKGKKHKRITEPLTPIQMRDIVKEF